MYQPDGWVVVKVVNPKQTFYRVFGSWRGGYLHGDSWRMNSGITKCYKENDCYCFEGASGSVYRCHKESYDRLGAYNSSVLGSYMRQGEEKNLYIMTIMPEDTDWTNIEYNLRLSNVY